MGNINEKNINLIANLIYLEEGIDYLNIKEKNGEDFLEKYFPYTIIETIGILINYDFNTGDKWKKFEKSFNQKYGSILENTFYNNKNEEGINE